MPNTQTTFGQFLLCVLLFLAAGFALASEPVNSDKPSAENALISTVDARFSVGQKIYNSQCADCHGGVGEGVAGAYDSELVGDLSVGELSRLISTTMPQGDPEACMAADATAVSEYIHYQFYSPAAQIRNRPPKIALARLTGEQLRQSLSDLYAHFAGIATDDREAGLRGIYFNALRWKDDEKKIERIDPYLNFNFGQGSPDPQIGAEEFYIHWNGGLQVEQSGRYEILVHSTCSFEMNLGRDDKIFIDNNVQSGDKTEFRRSVALTAGRVAPIKIELKKRKTTSDLPDTKFSMSWVTPNGTEQIIPARNLRSGWVEPSFSLQTILPPDDRSYGYDRGIAVNRQWDESTTVAAIEFASAVESELWPAYRHTHRKETTGDREKLRAFLTEMVGVAFHGQLDEASRTLYIDRNLATNDDDAEAIKTVLLMTLKSPRFLYPALAQTGSASEINASRLYLTMFDSLPSDSWVLKDIAKDKFVSEGQVRGLAGWMADDFRTHGKLQGMLRQWLNLDHITEITKDPQQFGSFDAALAADLRRSLLAFCEDTFWSESSDYRQLFQADWMLTNERIAEYYGDPMQLASHNLEPNELQMGKVPNVDALQKSVSDPEHRFGILTHPYLLSGLAYHSSTSPIHRGVFLIRSILGRTLRPPNEAFTPFSADLHPSLTTRERVALQTGSESCQVCHVRINGLGFVLENYDAVGRFRTIEHDQPIDTSGLYNPVEGDTFQFKDAKELATFLADSPDAQRAFVDRMFQHFVKQPIAAYGPQTQDKLYAFFVQHDFNMKKLLIEIAVVAAMNEPELIVSQE